MTARILVAEDETAMRTRLLDQLADVWPASSVVAAVGDGLDAWDAFVEHEPDVVFLDIRMPGMSGLDVAARIAGHAADGPSATRIVFVTAYDQFAVDAFERGAIDYLLKPIERERLVRCVRRLTQPAAARTDVRPALREIQANAGAPQRTRWIKATLGRKIQLINVEDILFMRADTKYTRIVHADGEALIRTPLRELVGGLDPEVFWQVHRSAVVNAHAIASVERLDSDQLAISIKGRDEKVAVSRAFMHLFKD